jgi:hypothetical protein
VPGVGKKGADAARHCTFDRPDCVHLVLIVRVDALVYQAQFLVRKDRYQRQHTGERFTSWDLELHRYTNEDDKNDTITESFKAGFAYAYVALNPAARWLPSQ